MNVRVQYSVRFMAGVYYDNTLQFNEYTIKVYMMTATENPADHNIALTRIKHFIYNEMEGTIFIDGSNTDQCHKLVAAGLNITTMPCDPVDQIIGIMLFTKMAAITEDRLIIGEVEISSAMSDGVVYFHGESENINDVEPAAWWSTCDLVHCDPDLIDTDKIVTMHKGSVWRELDLAWPDIEDNTDEEFDETGNTVVFADFKRLDDKE